VKVRTRYLIGVLLLLAALGTTAAAPDTRNYRAHLSGGPAGADTLSTGQAIFQFSEDGTALHYKLIVANLDNVTQAHIHIAPAPGQNGPVRLWLYPAEPPLMLIEGTSQGVLAEGVVHDGDAGLVVVSLSELKTAIDEGRAYVNVHTTAYPGGEIRGQIH
jgi:hypothetical protein